MQIVYKTRNGRMEFTIEAKDHLDAFEQLSAIQEVFEDLTCTNGKVSSDVVKFVVREVEDNKYYEVHCVDTTEPNKALRYARKRFGVHKKGKTLFPKKPGWV